MIWAPSFHPPVRVSVRRPSVFRPSEICPSGWISPTPINLVFRYYTHAFITVLPWILWCFVRIKFKMDDLLPFLFAQIDKIFEKCCLFGWISPTPINIVYWYFTHAFTTILPYILWSFVRIKFKIADLLTFLFAQIDKIFENVVRPDEYLQHQNTFLPDTLHMH